MEKIRWLYRDGQVPQGESAPLAADDIYDLVERAMEYAFEGKYLLNFYALLEGKKAVKREADEFIKSSTADELRQSIQELSGYIKGGDVVLKVGIWSHS